MHDYSFLLKNINRILVRLCISIYNTLVTSPRERMPPKKSAVHVFIIAHSQS